MSIMFCTHHSTNDMLQPMSLGGSLQPMSLGGSLQPMSLGGSLQPMSLGGSIASVCVAQQHSSLLQARRQGKLCFRIRFYVHAGILSSPIDQSLHDEKIKNH